MFLAEGHDPDSFVREHGATAFEDALQDSLTCHQFFFNTLSQEIDLQSLAGKSQLVNKAKPFLAKIPDGPYKQLLIDELARLTRIESHRLTQLTSEKLDTSPQVNLGITRTPTRVALAILLQNPDTIATLRDKLPKTPLEGPNGQLLQDLLNQITNRPDLTTAMLIEPWRDTPVFDSLTKLATWDHQVPEEALANEFVDILCFLGKQNQEQTIAHLLDKSRQSGLTETERNTLQSLLKERHAHTKEKIR